MNAASYGQKKLQNHVILQFSVPETRVELAPHITGTCPSNMRVYQFRHPGLSLILTMQR